MIDSSTDRAFASLGEPFFFLPESFSVSGRKKP